MSVNYDKFLSWVKSRFDPSEFKLGRKDEIRLKSIFHPDENDKKFRLYCSPSGGKEKRPNGVYHCFDTDKKGSLLKLVTIVDNCSYEEAAEILEGNTLDLKRLEQLANEIIFGEEKPAVKPKACLELPANTYRFNELPSNNYHRIHGESYLKNRRLPTDDFMVCTNGHYRNRIVIPYYDRDGKLIYYNGRYMGDSPKVKRYQFPDKEVVDRSHILYFPKWPIPGSKVYLAEGEFDAYSLYLSGFDSAAFGGKYLAETQMNLLACYIPVLCLDSDSAGGDALPKIGDDLLRNGFPKVNYVRPPKQLKDWNALLQAAGPNVLKTYIHNNEQPYSSWTGDSMGFKKI